MAKTTVTKHKFYVVDLVRKKPKTTYIEIPATRVDVNIEVTTTSKLKTPKEVPSQAMQRLEKAARDKLDEYEDTIASEAARLDAKIVELMKTPGKKAQAEAEQMIQATNAMIKKALASAEGAAQQAIQARLKDEAKKDSLLKEARVKTTLKVSVGVIKIAGSVAKLVATSGADVTSYKTIVVEVVKLGVEINQQLKNEEKLRSDLKKAVAAYLDLRGTVIMQAATKIGVTDTSGLSVSDPKGAITTVAGKFVALGEEVTKGKSKEDIAKVLFNAVSKGIKAKLNDAEKARTAYREHTTKTRHRTDSLSASADKLMKKVKAATTLKDGVKLGAECMSLKRQVSAMADKLADREKYLDEAQTVLRGAGLEFDDKTTLDKLKELDKKTILSEGKGVIDTIKEVKSLVDNVVEAVA